MVCYRGASGSLGSKERKRQTDKQPVKSMGSRTDMALQKVDNGMTLEYGAAEDASLYDGILGRKRMHEAKLNLPKTLKDRLGVLCNDCHWDTEVMRKTKAIGYCHSGRYENKRERSKVDDLTSPVAF
jgi:hypothetical protein